MELLRTVIGLAVFRLPRADDNAPPRLQKKSWCRLTGVRAPAARGADQRAVLPSGAILLWWQLAEAIDCIGDHLQNGCCMKFDLGDNEAPFSP